MQVALAGSSPRCGELTQGDLVELASGVFVEYPKRRFTREGVARGRPNGAVCLEAEIAVPVAGPACR